MRLIGLVLTLGFTLALIAAEGQSPQNAKIAKIGVLSPATAGDPAANAIEGVFQDALRRLGWIKGHNLILERRFVGGRIDQFASAARELVELNIDLIVAWSPAGTVAAKNATSVIPIVFLARGAAVEHGLVAGLPRPGGNLTEGSVVRGQGAPGESDSSTQELTALVEHALVDHPIGSGQQLRWNCEAQRLGRSLVHDKLESARLLYR